VTAFVIVDGTFVLSGLPKIPDGAWVPLLIAVGFSITSIVWLEGRRCVSKTLLERQIPLDQYMSEARPTAGDAKGTMVFLTGDQHGVPFLGGNHKWIRARADEERVVLLTLVRAARPYVADADRVDIDHRSDRLTLITASFGYMDPPRVSKIFGACADAGTKLDSDETSFFYAEPKLVRAAKDPLPRWVRGYYAVLARNSRPLPDDMEISAERQVKVGIEVPI